MKRFLTFFILMFFIVGCAKDYYYRSEKKIISDENVEINFLVNIQFINISIKNKTSKIIKVIWDECAFINQLGESFRIAPPFVPLSVAYQPKTPTIIAPNGIDNNLLKTSGIISVKGEKAAKKLIGLKIGLIITISIDNIKKSFYSEAEIKDVFAPEARLY